jgi:hypothetical protein
MLMGFYYLTYQRARFLSFSQSHYSIPLVIGIPPGAPFTAFEKLFNPFQFSVWISLLMTVFISLIVIFIINCQRQNVKNFIYGETRTPYLNVLNVLLNGFQEVLPKRTFARSLLMMFMAFCFIFRTLYQGSLYQFLQADDSKPEMASIDEMMEKNFVFYIRSTLEHNIRNMSFYNR